MSTQPSQAKTIRLQLLSDMKEGAYADCERLPRESVLAEKLGISRTQLRDILASLEREGFIYTMAGKGSFVAQKNLDLIREENLKKIEEHMNAVYELGTACGLSREELMEMFALLGEGE